MLKRVLAKRRPLFSAKAARQFSCEKLEPLTERLYKALSTDEAKVRSTYEGLTLPHLLGLLSTAVETSRFSQLHFADDLVDKTLEKITPFTARGSKQRLGVDLVLDLLGCFRAVSLRKDAAVSQSEERLVAVAASMLKRYYAALAKSDKEMVKESLKELQTKKEKFDEDCRKKLDGLESHLKKVDRMNNTKFTNEYLKAFHAESYLETEKDFDFDFDQEHDCFQLMNKKHKKGFSLFQFGHFDSVGQIMRYKDFMERTPNIDSLVIDVVPSVDPGSFKKPDPGDQKLYEYSQNIVNDWPYLYKFHGKKDLQKLYYTMVFDRDFYEERNELFYYKLDKYSRVLDVNNTLMAYFTGYGDRTPSPSVYLSALILEERVIEATYSCITDRSRQLCDLNSLQHILASVSLLESSVHAGCSECGGWLETLPYYQSMEKILRSELESAKAGSIAADVMMEAFQRLPESTHGVFAASTANFDRSLPVILDRIRQQRLSGYDPLEFKRQDHIKSVFSKSSDRTVDGDFFKHLAQVESVMGRIESTLNQFVDLAQNESMFGDYERKRIEMVDVNTLGYWDPSFRDTDPGKFCLAEHVVLPFQIENKVPKRIWHTGDKNELDLMKKIDEKLAKYEKSDDTQKHGKGRKIKMKPREAPTPALDQFSPFDTRKLGSSASTKFGKNKGRD